MNNKRNDTSFSVQNITTKAVLKNSDRCHISLLFVTITETLTTQTKLSQSPYSRRKDPKWCIAIKSLQRPQSLAQRLPLSKMTYWIIRLVKSRSRTRFMPIGWRLSTSQNNHNVHPCFRAIFVPFLIKKHHFYKFFTEHFDIQEITLIFTFQNGGTSRK